MLLVGRHALSARPPRRPGREREAVRLGREYLEEHAQENVTLRALAGHARPNVFHLCRVFHGSVGLTPQAYQRQVRVRRAKSMLRQGVPIARGATLAGFSDQAHLTRQFKRVVGLTPGRYVSNARS
ncbi:helix-turn-helix transcriptional regulator [Nonomuraea sp. NPDC050783]|uniref:helix-turn-helix transcriptional regulator n=1 Tax=Nonomuraea sp. NPDC050783 TaxID=3154634 RepID=UPI003467380F